MSPFFVGAPSPQGLLWKAQESLVGTGLGSQAEPAAGWQSGRLAQCLGLGLRGQAVGAGGCRGVLCEENAAAAPWELRAASRRLLPGGTHPLLPRTQSKRMMFAPGGEPI